MGTPVYIPQFTLVSSTNVDLEDLDSNQNIGYYNGNIYWAEVHFTQEAGGVDFYIDIKYTDSITGSTSTLVSQSVYTFIGAVLANAIYTNVTLFINDDDIFAVATAYVTSEVATYCLYTENGGSSWADVELYQDSGLFTVGDPYVGRVFKISSTFYVPICIDDDTVEFQILNAKTAAEIDDLIDIDNGQSWYGGVVVSSIYYFIYYDSADLKLMSFNGTTISTVETLSTLSIPASWNYKSQIFWKQKNVAWIMDEDHLYTRVGSNAWQSKSGSGETTNAIIWDYDANGNYQINYVIWKDTIFEVTPGGGLKPIQDTFENAYVGWDDWFANGADAIYQIDHVTTRYGHSLKFNEVLCKYDEGIAEVIDKTDYRPKVLDWGTWISPDLSLWTLNASIDTAEIVAEQNGLKNVFHIIADSAEEVTIPFTAQTTGEIEFKIELAQVNKIVLIRLDSTAGTSPCQVEFQSDGNIDFTGATSDTDIQAYLADTVYHVRIVFTQNSTCYLYLDGILISSITGNNVDADQFYVVSGSADAEFYLAKVGFSWDGYITYSNLLTPWKKGDGITLYDYRHELGFTGFIFDIQDNDARSKKMIVKAGWRLDCEKEITYTISNVAPDTYLPAIATANFEFSLFDVEAGGTAVTQEWTKTTVLSKLDEIVKKDTWVWYADLEEGTIYLNDGTNLAPLDYKRAVPGVVDWGTAFEPDLSAWTDSSGADCTVSIVELVDGHKNIMELDDQSAVNNCVMVLNFPEQISGTIEIWFQTSDITKESKLILYDGNGGHSIDFYFDLSKFRYYDGSFHDIAAAASDTWYHLKFVFDCTTTWTVTIDGTEYGPYNFRGTPSAMDNLDLRTNTTDSSYQTYFDGLWLSWDGGITNRIFYPHASSVGAKVNQVTPQINTKTVARAIVTGKIVNGVVQEGTAQSTTVDFGDVVRDAEPNEPSTTVLDAMAQAIVDQGNVEYLEVVAFFYLMSPISWGRQIYFDYPKRRFDYEALGAPDLYFVNKSVYAMVGNYQKLSFSSVLLFSFGQQTEQDGESTKLVPTGGVDAVANGRRIIDVEKRVTWEDLLPAESTPDFDETDLTDDTNWNDLDLSSIVDTKKCRVQLNVHGTDNAAGSELFFRTNGNSNDPPNVLYTTVANQEMHSLFEIETDASGVIEIKVDPSPSNWTSIEIYVMECREA